MKPGVSVDEVVNPTFSPVLSQPTSIAIVGPAQGFQTNSEILLLQDNTPATLALSGVDVSTLTVTDATDPTGAAFVNGTDYFFDSASSSITRAMQTQINNNEEITLYYENPVGVGYTELPTLSGLTGYAPAHRSITLTPGNIYVQHQGILPDSEYTIVDGSPAQISVNGNANFLTAGSQQVVYVDYDDVDAGIHVSNVAVTLNGSTPVNLPLNGANWIVKNAPTASTDSVFLYTRGSTTDGDYILSGLSNSNTGESVLIQRSAGSTSMGVGNDAIQVQVSYSATSNSYFQPTRVYSQSDVEEIFGPAFDSSGNVISPVALASSIAFANGATNMVIQALFHLADASDLTSARSTGGTSANASDTVADWTSTLRALRDVEDVNVIVPVVSASSGTSNDNLTLAIFEAVQSHMAYMAVNNNYIISLCGEDATASGNIADKATLQSHATLLGGTSRGEATVLVSPSSYSYANPVTGAQSSLGGQYMAAALAGMLADNAIQSTLTRKQPVGFTGVVDFRSEMDKDADAGSGCLVVEAKQGIMRIRHAITTAVSSSNTRELSVVRGKYYMIETVQQSLDNQVVGQVYTDGTAGLAVQQALQATLQELKTGGVIVDYQDMQTTVSTTDPTSITVRYSYLPPFPVNYINIVFSINTANGNVTSSVGQGA